jgi:hypothetical protein
MFNQMLFDGQCMLIFSLVKKRNQFKNMDNSRPSIANENLIVMHQS